MLLGFTTWMLRSGAVLATIHLSRYLLQPFLAEQAGLMFTCRNPDAQFHMARLTCCRHMRRVYQQLGLIVYIQGIILHHCFFQNWHFNTNLANSLGADQA